MHLIPGVVHNFPSIVGVYDPVFYAQHSPRFPFRETWVDLGIHVCSLTPYMPDQDEVDDLSNYFRYFLRYERNTNFTFLALIISVDGDNPSWYLLLVPVRLPPLIAYSIHITPSYCFTAVLTTSEIRIPPGWFLTNPRPHRFVVTMETTIWEMKEDAADKAVRPVVNQLVNSDSGPGQNQRHWI